MASDGTNPEAAIRAAIISMVAAVPATLRFPDPVLWPGMSWLTIMDLALAHRADLRVCR
jgi:hypothetical protein